MSRTRVIKVKDAERDQAGSVKQDGEAKSWPLVTVENLADPRCRATDDGSEFLNVTVLEDRRLSHDPSMNQAFTLTRGNSSSLKIHSNQNREMSRWTQQPAFRKEFDRFKAGEQLTSKDAAITLGTTIGTMNAYLYRSTAKPSLDFLQNAAKIFGCSVSLFIDDPGADRPTAADLSSYSEIDRYRFDQIVHTLGDARLSDADKQMLFEDLKSRANWILNLKSRKD